MRIGLYGGCFNPIHVGHLAAARGARDALGLDRVIFIPSGSPPLKEAKGLAGGEHRLAMIRRAIADEPGLAASSIELDRAGPSFSVDTVRQLKESFPPDAELYFLLGDDCLERLPQWKGIDQLFAMCTFAIVPREKPAFRRIFRGSARFVHLDLTRVDVSSTQIREKLTRGGQMAPELLPQAVLDYIEQHQIYPTLHEGLND